MIKAVCFKENFGKLSSSALSKFHKKFIRFSLIVFFAVFILPAAFADLYKPHRIFEIGFDSELLFANSSFGLKDVMKKKLEIDLQQISSDIPKDGFKFNLNERELFLINLNASSRFRFGFYTGVESYSNLSISKSLFDLLSDGLAVGESHTYDVSGCSDMFFDVGLSFQTIIMLDALTLMAPAITTANKPLLLNTYANCHLLDGKQEEAKKLWQQIKNLNPNYFKSQPANNPLKKAFGE